MDTRLPEDFHEIERKTAIAAARPRPWGWGVRIPLAAAVLISGIAIGSVLTNAPDKHIPPIIERSDAIYNAPCRQPQVGEKRIITTIPYADGRVDTACVIKMLDNKWPAILKQG